MKKIRFIIISSIIIAFLLSNMGYRFTSKGAARAFFDLNKDAVLVMELNTSVGMVYVYEQDGYYLNIVSERKGLLWRAPSGTTTKHINDKQDLLRTICLIGYKDKRIEASALVVMVNDENVAYIGAGPSLDRERKEAEFGGFVSFEWDRMYDYNELDPLAYSSDGEILYEYGNKIVSGFIDMKEFRWHKAE